MTYQAIGAAITNAMITRIVNSRESCMMRLRLVAPNTLRIPTSFFFRSAVNEANPTNPRHAMKIARPAKRRRPVSVSKTWPMHWKMRVPRQNRANQSHCAERSEARCRQSPTGLPFLFLLMRKPLHPAMRIRTIFVKHLGTTVVKRRKTSRLRSRPCCAGT